MTLFKPFRILSKLVPYPDLDKSNVFVEWKNRLLFMLLAGLLFLGLIAYVPSIIFAVAEKAWAVVVIDTLAYLVVIVTALSSKIPSQWKVNIILTTFYFLGIALLLLLGKDGAGFNWLYVFPILTGFFYEYRGVIISTLINLFSFVLLFIPVYFQMEDIGLISEYNAGGWIVNSINFLVTSVLLSMGMVMVISNINKSLIKEKRMRQLLQKNRNQLKNEKKKAEDADRLKSAFLANMSHEIRTPLNAIIGFSGLISNPDYSPEKKQQFSSLINISGNQLIGIIDDIIDISKIEHGQMNLNIKPVEIYSNLTDVVEIQKNRIEALKKDIEIDLYVDNNLKDIVTETDEIRFKQICNNLIGNAIKYTEKGTIKVGFTKEKYNGKAMLQFFVKDTGRGIPAEDLEKIFERFSQADNIDFHEGTGLGLSITKGLLDLLGGKIWVHSEIEKGSEFYFTLPLKLSESENKPSVNISGIKFEVPNLKGRLIYVAEDNNFSYSLILEILKTTKASVKRAVNGKELLLLINQKLPDLVLLDIKMPDMNGIEALHDIRAKHPDLPVIAQTAHALPEEQEKYLQYGCNACITKPFKPNEIIRLVAKWIHHN